MKKSSLSKSGRRPSTCVNELTGVDFWRAILSELLTSFLLATFVYGSTIKWHPDRSPSTVHIALVVAFTVRTLIYGHLHIGGAHFNPAITCAFLAAREISVLQSIFYIGAQCGGTILGGIAVQLLTPGPIRSTMAVFRLGQGVTILQGIAIEFVLTFCLLFVIYASKDDNRRNVKKTSPPSSAVAAVMVASVIFGINYTGGCLNPAIALGTAFASDYWHLHWIYWLGPITGGVTASVTYKYIFAAESSVQDND
ncbi:aquaporin-4-like [Glandiceps talaboti]